MSLPSLAFPKWKRREIRLFGICSEFVNPFSLFLLALRFSQFPLEFNGLRFDRLSGGFFEAVTLGLAIDCLADPRGFVDDIYQAGPDPTCA